MKRLIAIMGVAIILFVAALTFRREDNRALPPPARQSEPARLHPRSQRDIDRPVVDATPEPQRLSLPSAELDQLTPQAQQLLRESLRTFQRVELEKRNFKSHSPGERLLSGLQRKLFLEDFTYAKILSGGDCSQAGSVFTNLLQQIATLDEEALKQGISGL